VTSAIYDNGYTCWNSCPANPGDEGGGLSSYRTDTDRIGLRLKTNIANIDIVTVATERALTGGRVLPTGRVVTRLGLLADSKGSGNGAAMKVWGV